MQETDRTGFYALVSDVHAFYRQQCSTFALAVWWEACKHFDASAVKDAFNRHAVNPDNGQFLPKPADIVKLIGGGTQDAALVAWSKVDKAVRSVGSYRSVVFDDPLIHAVISDMGGWGLLCNVDDKEWPFKAKEFENRYRGYRTRGRLETWPQKLIGTAEAHNTSKGYVAAPPLMIGDAVACEKVYRGGSDRPALALKPLQLPEVVA